MATFNSSTVLTIEDNNVTHSLLAGYLNNLDLTTLQAEDGATGMNLLRRNKPDLLLLDMQLP
ncbi:MAG: response regulator, partial [Desulfobulbaceae bacterium]|nr:response regulator [Desulfobulbaceae bacterium]